MDTYAQEVERLLRESEPTWFQPCAKTFGWRPPIVFGAASADKTEQDETTLCLRSMELFVRFDTDPATAAKKVQSEIHWIISDAHIHGIYHCAVTAAPHHSYEFLLSRVHDVTGYTPENTCLLTIRFQTEEYPSNYE